MSDTTFSAKLQQIAEEKALKIVEEYFDGKRGGIDSVNAALSILGKAIQVRHQDRVARAIERGQNIRVGQFFLETPEARRAYIKAMQPELGKFLPSAEKGAKGK